MKKVENERYKMMLAVMIVVNASSLVWQNLVAFVIAFSKFKGFVLGAKKADDNAAAIITGVAAAKKQARITMAEEAMVVKGAVQAFAKATGNIALFKSVNFSKSKITNGKSTRALSICEVIYSAASDNLAELADFGINAARLQDFRDKMDFYSALISAPTDAKAARGMFIGQITKNIDDADGVLKDEMDKMMELFKESAPEFYAQYFKDRKLIHGATNFTEVIATIFNALTHQPLPNVTMFLTSAVASYTDISGVDGVAEQKSMKPSLYNITFTCPGFVPKTVENVQVGLSENETLTVELTPLS